MSHFGELLLNARRRTGFTQKELAEKVDLDDSYISRLERGVYRPPLRDVVLDLAAALGISDDKEKYLQFLAAAGVLNDEDLEGFALVKVADSHRVKLTDVLGVPLRDIYGRQMPPEKDGENGKTGNDEDQKSDAPTYNMANAAISIPDVLLDSLGDQINEIKRLIDSISLTDEEEAMVASQLDTTERLLKFIAAQRKT